MQPKAKEKQTAISLRQKGFTYREILDKVPVAKSTLSLWLREVKLAKRQAQQLTERRRTAQLRGGAARHQQRVNKTRLLVNQARTQITQLSSRELWLIGLALYWAEGSKEKPYAGAGGVDFSNTDRRMIYFFVQWLKICCKVDPSRIYAHLYIHEYQKNRSDVAKRFWAQTSGISSSQITGIYYKRHNSKSRRRSFGPGYYGTLRVRVRRSSDLMRQIQGWVMGVCDHNWGVV
jgi:hypothetical protein